jgi:hypothetical protein
MPIVDESFRNLDRGGLRNPGSDFKAWAASGIRPVTM